MADGTHRIGPLAAIPVGEGRAYAVGGEQIAVFRPRAGGLHAVGAVCPHAGGPLADGQIDGTVVVCPLHLHVYELATGCARTGQPPLPVYPVYVDDDGQLVVRLPADRTSGAGGSTDAASGPQEMIVFP